MLYIHHLFIRSTFIPSSLLFHQSSPQPLIDPLYDEAGVSIRQCRMAREAEFTGMYALGDGQRQSAEFMHGGLPMGRNGVVDHGLYTMLKQILLQPDTVFAEDGIDVEDVVRRSVGGQEDMFVSDGTVIQFGDLFSPAVLLV